MELKTLIQGLTYADVTNRKDKSNPNRRWTYDEVDLWLKGEKLPVPGSSESTQATVATMPPYKFLKQEYSEVNSLMIALATNWDDGKKQLYRGLLSSFFKNFNPEIAGYCIDAEDEVSNDCDEDVVFWKFLYQLAGDTTTFYWKGKEIPSLTQFGDTLIDRLSKNSSEYVSLCEEILTLKLLSQFLVLMNFEHKDLLDAIHALEVGHATMTERDRQINYFTLGYLLSQSKVFLFSSKDFRTTKELSTYMCSLLEKSYDEFKLFCASILTPDHVLDPRFEAWLIALGKRSELTQWRNSLDK